LLATSVALAASALAPSRRAPATVATAVLVGLTADALVAWLSAAGRGAGHVEVGAAGAGGGAPARDLDPVLVAIASLPSGYPAGGRSGEAHSGRA
jgi:hypothetical protein